MSYFFLGRVTWPDLVTWLEMTLRLNFLEECEIHVWEGMQKTAAPARRRFPYSRKTSWWGQIAPLPTTTRAKVNMLGKCER